MVKPSFITSKQFLVLASCGVFLQLAYVNCGKGFNTKFQIDESTKAVIGESAFNGTLVDSPELDDLTTTDDAMTAIRRAMANPEGNPMMSTDTNQGGGAVDTSIPVTGGVDTTIPTAGGQCVRRSGALVSLMDSIKAKADPADLDNSKGELKDCEVGLVKFAAAAHDASGNLVKSVAINGYSKARVGLFCPFKNNVRVDLLARFFIKNKIRGSGVAVTHLCKFGTPPADCNPSHPNYFGGLQYGQYGAAGAVSNFTGGKKSDSNKEGDDIVAKIVLPNNQMADVGTCNTVALYSPLVIESRFGEGVSTLDPRATETFFDLTGNGVKSRISCVQNGSFLALPDQNGQIKNINQLFGDNTVGPDGKRSANGFEALGKWDTKSESNHYGVITSDDEVYHQLRLWEDRDCNGKASSDELSSLEANSIEGIRWIDHIDMQQIDAYGNQTLQRNVAFLSNNQHLRVFDLWFLPH